MSCHLAFAGNNYAKHLINNHVHPAVSAISIALEDTLGGAIETVQSAVQVLQGVWESTFNAMRWVWDNTLGPIVDTINSTVGKIIDAFNLLKDKLVGRSVWTDMLREMDAQTETYLSLIGRRFKELSEGQKYRYKVAKMLASGSSVWFLDEFAATLDRETAKIVAFCLQKVARRAGRTVILATSHEDLFDDASPSVYIRKGWGEEVHVEYRSNKVGETCSLMRRVKIREGGIADYNPLSYLHYRAGRPWGIKKIFTAELNRRVIGVIVYSVPPLKSAGRTKFLGYTPKAEEVNRDFLIISRVILHPKYRSIGLGTRLVRETLPLAGSKYVEAIAVMARYNPFFNKAGMQEVPVDSTFSTGCQTILDGLKKYGFNPHFCSSIPYNLRLLNRIDEAGYNRFIDCLTGGGKKLFLITGQLYRRKTPHLKDLQRDLRNKEFTAKVIRTLAFKAQRKKYFASRI